TISITGVPSAGPLELGPPMDSGGRNTWGAARKSVTIAELSERLSLLCSPLAAAPITEKTKTQTPAVTKEERTLSFFKVSFLCRTSSRLARSAPAQESFRCITKLGQMARLISQRIAQPIQKLCKIKREMENMITVTTMERVERK